MHRLCKIGQRGVSPFLIAILIVAISAPGSVWAADKISKPTTVDASTPKKVIKESQLNDSVHPVKAPRPPRMNPATFTPDMPFSQAIDILRNCIYPPLNIAVLWRDLDEKAGIEPSTPIGLDGLSGLKIRQYIELLLRSVSAGSEAELGYVIDGGAIIVATKDSLPKPKMEARIYYIADLAAPTSRAGMGMMPGFNGPTGYNNFGYNQGYNMYGPGYNNSNQGYNNTYAPGYNTTSPNLGPNMNYNSVGLPLF